MGGGGYSFGFFTFISLYIFNYPFILVGQSVPSYPLPPNYVAHYGAMLGLAASFNGNYSMGLSNGQLGTASGESITLYLYSGQIFTYLKLILFHLNLFDTLNQWLED
jgi:hypothetical protein